jgi:hypothetical protein
MDPRRQQVTVSNQLIIAALIAALIGIGAQKNVAEGFAKQYMERNGIPSQVVFQSYLEDMVDKYFLSLESAVPPSPKMIPPVISSFNCGDEGILQAEIIKTQADGNCFLHCVIEFRKDCLMKGIACPDFPLDASSLRSDVVNFMRSNLDNPTMCSGISLREYFNWNYGPSVPRSSRIKVRRSGEPSPERACFYVDEVIDFLNIMSQPGTHVDAVFIEAFAELYRLQVQVITQARSEAIPVEFMDDPRVEALMAFGVSLNDAKQLLIKFQGNVNQAMDEVLQQREPEPVVDLSTILWQIQPYGKSTDTRIGIVCSSGHYELMLPPPISHQPEQQIRLPPRKPSAGGGGSAAFSAQPAPYSRKFLESGGGAAAVLEQPAPSSRKPSAGGATVSRPQPPQKPSAGGGGAAISSHQSPPSFGYTQEVSGWIEQLKEFFPSLAIDSLLQHMVMPSGKCPTTDKDIETNMILLSSIAFYAENMFKRFKRVVSAFLYAAPNVNGHEFQKVHSIVASFSIGQQMFRCTAVVFKDEHVIAFPGLKRLKKGNPKRDQLRKEFYAAIDAHFQKNPRVVIKMMLIEPCD